MDNSLDREQVCVAFCEHRFEDVFPYLATDVRWTVPGYMVLEGADALMRTCRDTTGSLEDTTVRVDRRVVADGGDVVVVDTFNQYRGPNGVTAVSRCHIFEFAGAQIAAITSYAVEVDPENIGAQASQRSM
jgi:SnoaL-like domain